MLYIFLVDTGTMYTFSMNVNMEPVFRLNEEIAKVCKIPVEKQVLLISGGEPLNREKLVCSYSAGSDNNNPIYLFCKSTIEGIAPPSPSIYHGSDVDLNSQVEGSLIMPPAFDTVVSRTQLAMQIYDIDADELKACEKLVHDQHLQQQGWAAVVANLEDLVNAFYQRAKLFQKEFRQFLMARDDVQALLKRIPDVLVLLEKIPILMPLECHKDVLGSGEKSMVLSGSHSKSQQSLYAWINTQDPKNRLEDVISNLTSGAMQMNDVLEEKVKRDLQEVTDYISRTDMKEVKGLEDRLYGLDQLMSTARKLVEEQQHMTQGFIQNQTRVSDLRDNSILPDLCSSHRRQLVQMLANHKKLNDIKRKCTAAKEELSENLHTRLRWVMYVQRTVNTMDNKLWLYHDNMDRIKARAGLLRQVESAPQTYAAMVVEVARRRLFSQRHLKWAEEISQNSRSVHKRETQRRKSFTRQYGSHFLQKMFVGFRDTIPKFAAEPPKEFDGALPAITPKDVSSLAQAVPELKQILRIPSDTATPLLAVSIQQSLATDVGFEPDCNRVTQSVTSLTQSMLTSAGDQSGADEQALEHIEREKMSMSYQDVVVGKEERLVEDRLALSLQEKFKVPECLSETLTAEVNSAAMSTITVSVMSASQPQLDDKQTEIVLQQEESTDGQLLSSGDHEHKSSDSDAISHESHSERKPHSRRQCKTLSDTSPDVETSQEFTTADFYIEDSMPSSITDSPPKPVVAQSKKSEMETLLAEKAEVDTLLAEKTKLVSKLECELSALQTKLSQTLDRQSQLQSLLNTNISFWKDSLAGIRAAMKDSQTATMSTVLGLQNEITGMCTAFFEAKKQQQEELLSVDRNISQQTISNLQLQLEVKAKFVEELQQDILKNSKAISDLNKEILQFRESSEIEISVLKEKHKAELEDVTSKNMLEIELESDRVRTELQAEMDRQDAEIAKLEEKLQLSEMKMKQLMQEKEISSEEMMKGFVVEKEKIHQILVEEFDMIKQKELMDLRDKLKLEHEEKLEAARVEMQQKIDLLCQEANREKSTEIQNVHLELKVKMEAAKEMLKTELKEQHEAELQKQHLAFETKLNETIAQCRAESEMAFETRLNEALVQCRAESELTFETRVNEAIARCRAESESTFETRVNEAIARCRAESELQENKMKEELLALQRPPLTDQCLQCDSDDFFTLEQHRMLLTEAVRSISEEKTLQFQKLLEEKNQEYENKLDELMKQHQKEKEDILTTTKTNLMADRQVQFNVAVSRACQEKDRAIEELTAKVKTLEKLVSDQSANDEDSEMKNLRLELSGAKERISGLIRENYRLEDQSQLLQQQMRQYSDHFHPMVSPVVAPVAPLSPNVIADGGPSLFVNPDRGAMDTSVVRPDLDQNSIMQAQRIRELEARLMNTSMTASTRREVRDKVSILNCFVGDLVLLCLDERHDQYVVFTVGNTLHFLHSDCVESLGLKPVEGESRKNWVLAEVTEREYCQARKAQNRFKVPVGTKFYRVKAKPWVPGI